MTLALHRSAVRGESMIPGMGMTGRYGDRLSLGRISRECRQEVGGVTPIEKPRVLRLYCTQSVTCVATSGGRLVPCTRMAFTLTEI